MKYLVSIAVLAALYFSYPLFSNNDYSSTDSQRNIAPSTTEAAGISRGWPPRAQDGEIESFFSALKTYFNTLLSAEQILDDARAVADKAEQRQQLLEQINQQQ